MAYFGKTNIGKNKEVTRSLENLFSCYTEFESGGIHVYLNPLTDSFGSCLLSDANKKPIAETRITKLPKGTEQWYIFYYTSERIKLKPGRYWLSFTSEDDVEAFYDIARIGKIYSIYDNLTPLDRYPYTIASDDVSSYVSPIKDIVTLEAIRNIEMSAGGRFYINEQGQAVYESRYARNP